MNSAYHGNKAKTLLWFILIVYCRQKVVTHKLDWVFSMVFWSLKPTPEEASAEAPGRREEGEQVITTSSTSVCWLFLPITMQSNRTYLVWELTFGPLLW